MASAANDMSERKKACYTVEYRAEALALAERIGLSVDVHLTALVTF